MFKEWGFLLGEIWVLLLIAGGLGLLAGWIIWGRQIDPEPQGGIEEDRLKAELQKVRAEQAVDHAKMAQLQHQLDLSHVAIADAIHAAPPTPNAPGDLDGDGIVEGPDEGRRPAALPAPEDGQGDDLRLIKGIGPKLAALCNEMGFWHFYQIANWTDQEVAWVDSNLTGFKGRVSRDNWVDQARTLTATGFAKRPD